MSFRSSWISWLLVVLAALAVAFAPFPAGTLQRPTERVFRVQASQYAYAPGELHVNPGDIVTIELISTDTVHGLYVDVYGVSVDADPGQTASLTFVADRPGSFRFRCNVTCGALHPFMIGKLTVGSNILLYRGAGLALLGALGVMLALRRTPDGGTRV
ncbi:MAG: cupredoxin domain-containing protein [Chloroflexota bacterium]